MYLVSPETYTGMAVTAGNGGLIPWQTGWATRVGRFQFVLGRELGATFYGYGLREHDPRAERRRRAASPRVVDFKSIHFDCRSSNTGRTAPSTPSRARRS